MKCHGSKTHTIHYLLPASEGLSIHNNTAATSLTHVTCMEDQWQVRANTASYRHQDTCYLHGRPVAGKGKHSQLQASGHMLPAWKTSGRQGQTQPATGIRTHVTCMEDQWQARANTASYRHHDTCYLHGIPVAGKGKHSQLQASGHMLPAWKTSGRQGQTQPATGIRTHVTCMEDQWQARANTASYRHHDTCYLHGRPVAGKGKHSQLQASGHMLPAWKTSGRQGQTQPATGIRTQTSEARIADKNEPIEEASSPVKISSLINENHCLIYGVQYNPVQCNTIHVCRS